MGVVPQDELGRFTALGELALSFVHLFANRLLRTATRAQELVLSDMLVRVYASRRALEPRP